MKHNSVARRVFIGPNGLRAGWRLLIFLIIIWALSSGFVLVLRLLHVIPTGRGGVRNTLTPADLMGFEGTSFLLFCIATWIMAKIEGRRFGQYGLPWVRGLQKDVLVGALWGFLAISGMLLVIFVLHGFRITGLAIHGRTIFISLVEWSVVFLLVGLFEEFSFRGYAQFTLATGIGFWPSAFLISALFGWVHRGNSGENIFGELSVVLFGLLFCLFLWRRGNLWWAVGFHMGYDWGQTFFYGVPDSGLLPYHSLLSSSFTGPKWLTGGTVGPEASVFLPIALLTVAVLFSRRYREVKYQALLAPSLPARAS